MKPGRGSRTTTRERRTSGFARTRCRTRRPTRARRRARAFGASRRVLHPRGGQVAGRVPRQALGLTVPATDVDEARTSASRRGRATTLAVGQAVRPVAGRPPRCIVSNLETCGEPMTSTVLAMFLAMHLGGSGPSARQPDVTCRILGRDRKEIALCSVIGARIARGHGCEALHVDLYEGGSEAIDLQRAMTVVEVRNRSSRTCLCPGLRGFLRLGPPGDWRVARIAETVELTSKRRFDFQSVGEPMLVAFSGLKVRAQDAERTWLLDAEISAAPILDIDDKSLCTHAERGVPAVISARWQE